MARTKYTAPWIIAHRDGAHRTLRDGCVVVDGKEIVFVGHEYDGVVEQVVPTDHVITPGFISTHTHMQESPADKGIAEDVQKRQFWSTNLIEILPPRAQALSVDAMRACADFSVYEHLRTGATTVVQMGTESDYIADVCERVGLRAFIAESYRSGRWKTDDGRTVAYEWSDDDGRAAFDRGVAFARRHRNADGQRLVTGFLNPSQVDTCSAQLLSDSIAAADELDVPLQIHAAQSLSEFIEMTRRHARTPIEWLHDLGFLRPRSIIGHGLFLTDTSWTNFHGEDLEILARSGASVSYNAWVFGRNGIVMETFDRYREAGVNVVMGTDSVTQSMLDSCRWTAVLGKVMARRSDAATAGQVFDAATTAAARALGRDDIGRVAPGCKADLLFWRTDSSFMTPLRDPVRNIVYYAEPEDLDKVMVDGRVVMEDRRVHGLDHEAALAGVQAGAERVWGQWPEHDWAGRSMDEHVPLTYDAY